MNLYVLTRYEPDPDGYPAIASVEAVAVTPQALEAYAAHELRAGRVLTPDAFCCEADYERAQRDAGDCWYEVAAVPVTGGSLSLPEVRDGTGFSEGVRFLLVTPPSAI